MKLSETEVVTGNKLIAKYMGNEFMTQNIFLHRLPKDVLINSVNYKLFHSSWDWLKPVIDKIIKEIGFKCIDECSREEWIITTNVTRMHIGVSIEEAYIYVVEYINFYNKQKANGK